MKKILQRVGANKDRLDLNTFSPNLFGAIVWALAVYVMPTVYWPISERFAVWAMSLNDRPFISVLKWLEGQAPVDFGFQVYEMVPSGRVVYELLAPTLSMMTLLLGSLFALMYATEALSMTQGGRRLLCDVKTYTPRGEALVESVVVCLKVALFYFVWRSINSITDLHGTAASALNTLAFFFVGYVIVDWVKRIARAGQREESRNRDGIQEVLRWWRVIPSTLAVIASFLTLQEVANLLF